MVPKNPANRQQNDVSGDESGLRLAWERPSLRRLTASDAEANMNAGMVDGGMLDMS